VGALLWQSEPGGNIVSLHVGRPANDGHAENITDVPLHVIRIRQAVCPHHLLARQNDLNRCLRYKKFRHAFLYRTEIAFMIQLNCVRNYMFVRL